MISRHVDVVAVLLVLLGMLVWSEVRQSVWFHMMKAPKLIRVEPIATRVPEPPVVPIVFE